MSVLDLSVMKLRTMTSGTSALAAATAGTFGRSQLFLICRALKATYKV